MGSAYPKHDREKRMSEQNVITLDSQILNTMQLCERRTKYTFIDSIVPSEKAEALERGDLMHKLLEIYEGLRCNLVDYESQTWRTLHEAGFTDESRTTAKEYAVRAARFLASRMDLGVDEINSIIYQFEEYVEYYKDDPWETLALESTGSKVLYEDDETKIIYTFKIDRLAKKDTILAPWDYKTSKMRRPTSSLSNQFMGYAWATDSNYVIVDKIGFQKTLSPAERFQRVFLSYDNERIEEWKANATFWAFKYAALLDNPSGSTMNLTSCDKYSGCIYRPICEKGESGREWVINRDYVKTEKWDPAKALEDSEANGTQ